MADKIKVTTPIVEIDGDEMTRVMWNWVKNELLLPFVEMDLKYFDLGLKSRNDTEDQITRDAATAIMKFGVGVKGATITPNKKRVEEYDLQKEWKSPKSSQRDFCS